METTFFWITWGVISFWALKTFYFSFSKEKLERLRKAVFGINLAVFILAFLPWLPLSLGGKTGLDLALEGNILAVLFLVFQIILIVLLLTNSQSNLKVASITTAVNAIILFVLMIQIRPGTFTLSTYDIAPIVAMMLLLVGDVAAFLLWQQLELKIKRRKKS